MVNVVASLAALALSLSLSLSLSRARALSLPPCLSRSLFSLSLSRSLSRSLSLPLSVSPHSEGRRRRGGGVGNWGGREPGKLDQEAMHLEKPFAAPPVLSSCILCVCVCVCVCVCMEENKEPLDIYIEPGMTPICGGNNPRGVYI